MTTDADLHREAPDYTRPTYRLASLVGYYERVGFRHADCLGTSTVALQRSFFHVPQYAPLVIMSDEKGSWPQAQT